MEPTGSLPQLLFDYARQPFEQLVQQAWGAALVLVALILTVRLGTNIFSRWRYGSGPPISSPRRRRRFPEPLTFPLGCGPFLIPDAYAGLEGSLDGAEYV